MSIDIDTPANDGGDGPENTDAGGSDQGTPPPDAPAGSPHEHEGSGPGKGAGSRTGPRNMPLIVTLLVAVGILMIVFSFTNPSQPSSKPMPKLEGMGLQYALAKARAADWKGIQSYDATGRNRGMSDGRDWQVCFQTPLPDANSANRRNVTLGAVKLIEACPMSNGEPKNYGELTQVYDSAGAQGSHTIPDLIGYTPFMVRQAFGDDASIQVLEIPVAEDSKQSSGYRLAKGAEAVLRELIGAQSNAKTDQTDEVADHTVTGDSGDWIICQQFPNYDPAAKGTWNGQPLTLYVIPAKDGVDQSTACAGFTPAVQP